VRSEKSTSSIKVGIIRERHGAVFSTDNSRSADPPCASRFNNHVALVAVSEMKTSSAGRRQWEGERFVKQTPRHSQLSDNTPHILFLVIHLRFFNVIPTVMALRMDAARKKLQIESQCQIGEVRGPGQGRNRFG
jgi:hypothetical protein